MLYASRDSRMSFDSLKYLAYRQGFITAGCKRTYMLLKSMLGLLASVGVYSRVLYM